MTNVFKTLIHQILQHSTALFADFAEQLNLEKIQSPHTDSEWADLVCLLFSKVHKAFVVIETDDLRKAHRHDPDWTECFLHLLQRIVDRTTNSGNQLKILLVVYGNEFKSPAATSKNSNLGVLSLPLPTPVPPRLRHMARRSGLNNKGWKLQKPKV